MLNKQKENKLNTLFKEMIMCCVCDDGSDDK